MCLAVDWQRLDWPQTVWLLVWLWWKHLHTAAHNTLSAAQFTLFSRKEASTCSRQQQMRRAASQQFAQQKNSRKPPAPENLRTCMAGCQPFPRSTQDSRMWDSVNFLCEELKLKHIAISLKRQWPRYKSS